MLRTNVLNSFSGTKTKSNSTATWKSFVTCLTTGSDGRSDQFGTVTIQLITRVRLPLSAPAAKVSVEVVSSLASQSPSRRLPAGDHMQEPARTIIMPNPRSTTTTGRLRGSIVDGILCFQPKGAWRSYNSGPSFCSAAGAIGSRR